MIRAKDAPQNLSAVSPCTAVNMTHFYLCSPLPHSPHSPLLYPFLSYSQSHSDAYPKIFAPNLVLLAFIYFPLLLNLLFFLHIYFFLFICGPWLSHFSGCVPPLFLLFFQLVSLLIHPYILISALAHIAVLSVNLQCSILFPDIKLIAFCQTALL